MGTNIGYRFVVQAKGIKRLERLCQRAALGNLSGWHLFFGPAHNNLGVLYLKQDKLYEAANEFEWARKLMPGHPDPRVNLAITLERAGKVEEALASYGAALEVYPDYLPAIEGMASLTLRAGKKDERLAGWLDAITMRAESAAWRAWASQRHVALRR